MSKALFIVAEPSFIVRKGLVSLINELPNATVVREVEVASRLAELITHYSAHALLINQELLLQLSGAELKKITSRKRKVFVIGISKSINDPITGCSGLISHEIALDEPKVSIIKKIKTVLNQIDESSDSPTLNSELSDREMVILKDVALGLSNKEIADKNFISPHTVVTHRKNITRKLGIKTVSGLTIYAILNKLIGMDELN